MGDSSGHHVPALSSQSGPTRMKEASEVLRKETILRRRGKGAKMKTPSGQACHVRGQALVEGPGATLKLCEEKRST